MAPVQATTISLRCKVPPGHIAGSADEFSLGTFSTSTRIGELRQRIQQQIPGNPAPAQQRILYGGRALVDDEVALADALNVKRDPTQEAYVIHLLIRGNNAGGSQPLSRQQADSQSQREAPPPGHGPPDLLRIHQQQAALAQLAAQQQQNPQYFSQQPQQHHPHSNLPPHHPFRNAFVPPHFPFGVPGFNPGVRVGPPHNGQTSVHAHGVPPQPHIHDGQRSQDTQEQGSVQSTAANPVEPTAAQAHVLQSQESRDGDANMTSAQTDAQQPASQPQLNGSTAPRRPISGQGFHMEGVGQNGQRITVHHQTFSYPLGGLPGLPPGMPMALPFPHLAGPVHHNASGPFPQATPPHLHETVQRMQSTLDQLEARPNVDDEQRAQIEALRQGVRSLQQQQAFASPAPPLAAQATPAILRTANPQARHVAEHAPTINASSLFSQDQSQAHQADQRSVSSPTNPTVPTCYILSSPAGPRALLFSPQYGAYVGPALPPSMPVLSPWSPAAGALPATSSMQALQQRPDEPDAANRPVAQPNPGVQIQGQNAPAEPIAPLQMIMGHFWLLLRITIFAYFLLGSNMGWRRPLLLVALGVGFWIVRMGLLGEGGPLRRWWEDVMRGPQPAGANREAVPQGNAGVPAAGRAGAARRMPTPEEFAQRLLNERARPNVPINPQLQWIRDQVRPAERAAALFVGSLWPGVGEAAVRAREAEDRRRAEEEIEARRQAEEARQREEAAREKKDDGAAAEHKETSEAAAETPASSVVQPDVTA